MYTNIPMAGGRLWTEAEISRLKKEYPSADLNKLANSMKRNINALVHKACYLKIKRIFWQHGENNPAYKNGIAYYRRVAFDFYGKRCGVCGAIFDKNKLEVHHKDKNRKNNKIHNLLVICRRCHMSIHHKGNGWPAENLIRKS